MSDSESDGVPVPGSQRRKTPQADPDAGETTCERCGATIRVGDEEAVIDAVIQHFQDNHRL